jgi:hypothetical protein
MIELRKIERYWPLTLSNSIMFHRLTNYLWIPLCKMALWRNRLIGVLIMGSITEKEIGA